MEVSQIAELDTHAVIGGGKAEAFEMSDSAEFFTVLSDTLYRDKKRAVIREVVCNAWDAHIMVGKTDLPVEITLTDDEMIIKDFGPGIADNRMRPIYCVYGSSTKVKDHNQTGGFGLGSKAPFAYSDHFTVTSSHSGFRTVYAISRGGAETQGKPDFRRMVRVPTKETGITVSIPLKSAIDRGAFEEIIKSVVYYGGMRANLNGKLLDRLDYEPARKLGFCVVPRVSSTQARSMTECSVYVLYGTVIYPIVTTDREVTDLVTLLASKIEEGYGAILIAPPNSIGVTPSREGLSYSELTTNTVKDLMNRAIKRLRQHEAAAKKRVYKNAVEKMERYNISTYFNRPTNAYVEILTDPFEITLRSVSMRTSSSYHSYSNNSTKYICKALQKRFRDDRRVFRRMRPSYDFGEEAARHSMRLAIRMASDLSLLSNLYFSRANDYSQKKLHPIDVIGSRFDTVFNGKLILAQTHRDALKWINESRKRHEQDYWTSGKHKGLKSHMIFVLPRSTPEQRDEIKMLAAKYKIDVQELSFVVKKRALSGSTKSFYDFSKVKWKKFDGGSIDQVPTLEKASVYIRCSGYPDALKIGNKFKEQKDKLLNLFPEIAVAMNAKQEAKLKMKGARPIMDVIVEELEKLADRRDVQYAHCAKNGLFIRGSDNSWHSVSETVRRLIGRDIRFAKLLFPDRVKFGPEFQRSKDLVHLLDELVDNYSVRSKLTDELNKKCAVTFAKSIITWQEANEKFAYLKVMINIGNSDDIEEICDIIRFLMRRHRQSSLIVKTETEEVESLKEAA